MANPQVFILDKDTAVGAWILNHLHEIGIEARWVASVSDLLSESELQPPVVCLVAIRAPVSPALTLITELTQEPRFAQTAFILMGPMQYKHAGFEAGADDYLITPPDVIELRKRVRLYLDRATLEARVVAETRITQEIENLGPKASNTVDDEAAITLLQHAATMTSERDQFHTILCHAGQAISLVSPEGVLLYANPAWENMTGQPVESALSQPIPWPPTAENPATAHAISVSVNRAADWKGEVCYVIEERKLEVIMSITPVFDADQELTGFVVTQLDVAERKALDDLKVRFLADAAIEMRTPVTNIKMRQYLLRQAPVDQHTMHLQALERETERLSRIVEAMLELSRIDAGLLQLTFESVDLNRLASDIVTRYGPTAENKGVTLGLFLDDTLPHIQGDPSHLARVLGILVENAIQHTPEAGHIEVRLGHEIWSGGAFATLHVQDTGIGIPREALAHIFNRFYRSERDRDSGLRGAGLGLAIAHEIISRHNGDITVESILNQGSTFTVWLPMTSQ